MFGRKKHKKADKKSRKVAPSPPAKTQKSRAHTPKVSGEVVEMSDEDVALLEGEDVVESDDDPKNANAATRHEAQLADDGTVIQRAPAVTDGARTHTPNATGGGHPPRRWKSLYSATPGV